MMMMSSRTSDLAGGRFKFVRSSVVERFRFSLKPVPISSLSAEWRDSAEPSAYAKERRGYLGNIEVYESRGMQVCEEAIKALRKSKKKPQKAILYVSGDALRVSDDVSQHLIVDQTIEKVSFCAPDRNHEKGFAYICRDGATRRWMCHAFLAVKESGERLSHAVGCAFAICLEKKQKRERDALQLAASDDRTFVRVGSFRPASLAERLIDPQSTIVTEPLAPASSVAANGGGAGSGDGRLAPNSPHSTFSPSSPAATLTGAIPRPRPSPSIIERQGSLRLFPKLQDASPFKRDLSLRLEELPSNLQRLARITTSDVIPEETGQELDEQIYKASSDASPSSLLGPHDMIRPSLPTPSNEIHSPPSTLASTLPTTIGGASLEQIFSSTTLTPLPTTITTTQSAASVLSLPADFKSSHLSPVSYFTDPFSAAPFNPATIQQHCQNSVSDTQQQHTTSLTQLPPRTTACSPPAISPNGSTSPFLGGPPIAAPMPRDNVVSAASATTPSSPWSNGVLARPYNGAFALSHQDQPSTICSSPTYATPILQLAMATPYSAQQPVGTQTAGAAALSPFLTGQTSTYSTFPVVSTVPAINPWLSSAETPNWHAPVPALLPPEPDRFSDPFDVGWADRATASLAGAAGHKPGNPFVLERSAVVSNSNQNPVSVNGDQSVNSKSLFS
ncbi:unnamed protein product [Calicophoron daubneyi]|uniref:PID domain-containing protein n=1 Tax=Calicophoron daubneyi TaxID=300641 RepID=A0AAV2T3V3_CALDB